MKPHRRHGGRVAADRDGETVQAPAADGPDEQAEQRAPDKPTDLPRRSWGAILKGTLKEFKKDELTGPQL
ncbi:hypothetical protein [Streptomyces mirabilis]|uniref:hypothetical protein n=1 Tax=Streptomyces mirabilis TaxID=68239 RepID=UPI00367BBBB5